MMTHAKMTKKGLRGMLLLILLLCIAPGMAQARLVLTAQDIFSKRSFNLSHSSVQGMDIWGHYLLSLQNTGIAHLYNFDGSTLTQLGSFSLASAGARNHSNLASFSNQYYADGDKLPLVYITRANATVDSDGMRNVCFVERIDPDKMSSTLIQKICYKPINGEGQFIIDRQNNLLYVWGNTISNGAVGNKHYVRKFKIPEVGPGKPSLVWLTDDQSLDTYYWEDYYTGGANPVIQGGAIKDDLMFLPCGFDTEEQPSVLYVWDLKNHKMLKELSLTGYFSGELEDCSVNVDGWLVLQANPNHIYMMSIKNIKCW